MSLQAGLFKSQSIVESILKSLLSLVFSLISIITFLFLLELIGFKYDINQIINYTLLAQIPHSLSASDLTVFFKNLALVIYWATPLILTGLSVAIAFKCGLFNIGGQGQMIMGGLFAGIFGAVIIPKTPILNSTLNSSPIIMIPTIIIISMVFGAIWAGIPGLLRAYTGAHEVITTIFMNQIAINLANYLVGSTTSPFVDKSSYNVYGQTASISPNAQILPINSSFSIYLNWSIFIVLFVVIIAHFLLWNTNFGFKIRATGFNKTASEVSGINTKRTIFYAMLLAGAFSGLAGGFLTMANYSNGYKYIYGNEGTSGFDGIAVSLIGLNSPLPILPAALLFGFLRQAKILLDLNTDVSSHIIVILQSFVVIFAAAPFLSAKVYKIVSNLFYKRETISQRFSQWLDNNSQSLIITSAFIIIPALLYFIFEEISINFWTFSSFFSFLMNKETSNLLTNIIVITSLLVFSFAIYKFTSNYVQTQKAKSQNMLKLTLKLFLTFIGFIEGVTLLFYFLVLISGILINPITFHQQVWNILISPITIRGAIIAAFPIIMGALGGAFNERAGVINIGLEGIMLTSAFGSVFFAYVTGNPYIGVLGGLIFGLLTALLHAVLTITFKAEQVVTGDGINLLALGLTDFLTTIVWNALQSNGVNYLPLNSMSFSTNITGLFSGLVNIPILGLFFQFIENVLLFLDKIINGQSVLLFFGILLIPICHILLFKTPFGLRLRVIGEEPSAAATAGIPVQRYQYAAVLISGFLTSIGGIYLAIGDSQYFKSNMTGGRGFTALAAMIFGKWTISGGVLSGLFFGYFYSLAINLSFLDYFSNIYRLLNMMPFIIAIMVLAGAIGLARPPKSIGKTYDPQD